MKILYFESYHRLLTAQRTKYAKLAESTNKSFRASKFVMTAEKKTKDILGYNFLEEVLTVVLVAKLEKMESETKRNEGD